MEFTCAVGRCICGFQLQSRCVFVPRRLIQTFKLFVIKANFFLLLSQRQLNGIIWKAAKTAFDRLVPFRIFKRESGSEVNRWTGQLFPHWNFRATPFTCKGIIVPSRLIVVYLLAIVWKRAFRGGKWQNKQSKKIHVDICRFLGDVVGLQT